MDQSDESDPAALPAYLEETLAGMEPAALIALMVRDEDRVPRNVIDACARHGEDMLAQLRRLVEDERPWPDREPPGEWWLVLHAVMILGLIPGEQAGSLLVQFMRRMAEDEDDDLQDWLAGWWPAFFRNKPGSVLPALRNLCSDRSLDWYLRAQALDCVIAAAEREGSAALDEALTWAAAIAADETQDWDLRLSAGSSLLDFAPAPHRMLLENLAGRQTGQMLFFSQDDVREAYSGIEPAPEWHRLNDPWKFYDLGSLPGARIGGRRRKRRRRKMRKTRICLPKSQACPMSERRQKLAATIPAPAAAGRNTRTAAWPVSSIAF